jgi:hypothetical protein
MPERIDSVIIGNAGEHYIMCQLLRRGWVAALAPTGVPNMDIIVTDKDSRKLCSISVKTRRDIGSDKGWHMGAKHERINAPDLFYCFIDFGKGPTDAARCYVLPSAVVCDVISVSHMAWLRQPGVRHKERRDNPMRRLLPDYSRHLTDALREREPDVYKRVSSHYGRGWLEQYLGAWHQLGLPSGPTF